MKPAAIEFKIVLSIVILATLSRIAIPPILGHFPNFSALDAIALFSGTYFLRRITAITVVLFSVGLSDLFLHRFFMGQWHLFYPGFYWQYLSYVLITLIGITLRNKITPPRLLFSVLSSSFLFFLISNFGTWLSGYLYPMTLSGLIFCYFKAIPFYKNTLLGDLFFSGLLFGSVEILKVLRFRIFLTQDTSS